MPALVGQVSNLSHGELKMSNQPDHYNPDINPATGLPMIDDTYLDVGGSPYGTDMHTPTWSHYPEPSYNSYQPPGHGFDNW